MMTAWPNDVRYANDLCLAAHWANITSLLNAVEQHLLSEAKNIISPQAMHHETIISNQIGRSGTSIGANIHEAQYAQGKKDFISKWVATAESY